MSKRREKSLTTKQYVTAIWRVARLSFSVAPWPVSFKLAGAIVNAVLPIATTFYAAATTTALASAFNGDQAAGDRAIEYVIITAILGLFTLAWGSIDNYVQQLMRFKVEAKVSDIMYEHFHQLDFWRYEDKDTADLYDKAQRFSQFFAYVFDRIANIVSSIATLIVALIALVSVVPVIALVVLIAVIPGIYFQFRLTRLQVRHWNQNITVRRSKGYIEWNLLQPTHIAELRVNGLVRHLLELRQELRNKDEHEQLNFERSYILKRLGADALASVAELGSLLWIAIQIINRAQPIGQFIYVQQIVGRAMSSATRLVGELSGADEDLANLTDYEQFMEISAAKLGLIELKADPQTISFQDVTFAYHGTDKLALDHLSLDIKAGEHIAVVGENGAGKSTFVKLLMGLYDPTSGVIKIDEVDLKNIHKASWHAKLAVLQQDFLRYQFVDTRHNVSFGAVDAPYTNEHYESAKCQAEAEEFIAKLPQKDETLLSPWMEDEDGENGTNISGGQWQRLALARSFYRDAPIIILDEPTSAIDALAEARIFKRLFSRKNKKTVISISHRLSTVERADRIYVLEDGRVAEQGTHAELVAKKGEYYTIFESQLNKQEKA